MRYAHVTRDGRVICSVLGCGVVLGQLHDDEELGRTVLLNANLIFDAARGVWRFGSRYRRYGTTHRRLPEPLRRFNREARLFQYVYHFDEHGNVWRERGSAKELVLAASDAKRPRPPERSHWVLPAVVLCPNGHQSIVDPETLDLDWWYAPPDGRLVRRALRRKT